MDWIIAQSNGCSYEQTRQVQTGKTVKEGSKNCTKWQCIKLWELFKKGQPTKFVQQKTE